MLTGYAWGGVTSRENRLLYGVVGITDVPRFRVRAKVETAEIGLVPSIESVAVSNDADKEERKSAGLKILKFISGYRGWIGCRDKRQRPWGDIFPSEPPVLASEFISVLVKRLERSLDELKVPLGGRCVFRRIICSSSSPKSEQIGLRTAPDTGSTTQIGDSEEVEQHFRREAEQDSGLKPNTIRSVATLAF